MAIKTYDELKAHVLNYMDDGSLEPLFDGFVGMAEEEFFNNDIEILDNNFSTVNATLNTTTDSNKIDLPTGYLKTISFKMVSGASVKSFNYKTPENMAYDNAGDAYLYTIIGNQIVLNTNMDSTVDIQFDYTKEADGLSDINPVNEILLENANLYVYGCLSFANDKIGEFQLAEMYLNKMYKAIKGTNNKVDERRYPDGLNMSVSYDPFNTSSIK